MSRNKMKKKTIYKIIYYLVASIIGFGILIPFFWMIITSLKAKGALMLVPIQWIPDPVSSYGFVKLFDYFPFARAAFNSVFLAVTVTLVSILSAAMAAFAFSKIDFRGRESLFRVFLITMMIPGQVTLIPMFIILRTLGLTNSFTGIILPSIFNAFAVFMLRQRMKTISKDYMDAAVIDGAGNFMIFFKLILPMSSAIVATLAVLTFMGSWNSYFWPLILLSDRAKMTLPLALSHLNGQYGGEGNIIMAGALLTMIPIIILYAFAQRYFKTGLSVGSIKG